MKLSLLTLIALSSFSFLFGETFAVNPTNCDSKTFSCYQENLSLYCENEYSPWNSGPNFGKITADYANFQPEDQNRKIQSLIESEKNPESKASLQKMLDLTRIGTFEGFRAVEIARIQYRNNMNRIFSCAVAAGRVDKLKKLEETLKKFAGKGSDIKTKLEKEKKRYETVMRDANCNQNTDGSEQIKIVDKLSRSATREYCSYSYYLDYLDSNIRENIVGSITLDQQIGTTKPSVAPSTTDAALSETTKRTNAVENELARAQDTLPKAVVAYREMERTYTVHLLLVIIYDDYLALRDNLKSYMNSLSQTFEKANNAQDANQR